MKEKCTTYPAHTYLTTCMLSGAGGPSHRFKAAVGGVDHCYIIQLPRKARHWCISNWGRGYSSMMLIWHQGLLISCVPTLKRRRPTHPLGERGQSRLVLQTHTHTHLSSGICSNTTHSVVLPIQIMVHVMHTPLTQGHEPSNIATHPSYIYRPPHNNKLTY